MPGSGRGGAVCCVDARDSVTLSMGLRASSSSERVATGVAEQRSDASARKPERPLPAPGCTRAARALVCHFSALIRAAS